MQATAAHAQVGAAAAQPQRSPHSLAAVMGIAAAVLRLQHCLVAKRASGGSCKRSMRHSQGLANLVGSPSGGGCGGQGAADSQLSCGGGVGGPWRGLLYDRRH